MNVHKGILPFCTCKECAVKFEDMLEKSHNTDYILISIRNINVEICR